MVRTRERSHSSRTGRCLFAILCHNLAVSFLHRLCRLTSPVALFAFVWSGLYGRGWMHPCFARYLTDVAVIDGPVTVAIKARLEQSWRAFMSSPAASRLLHLRTSDIIRAA